MDTLLFKLQDLIALQQTKMLTMSNERCDDIHSVLRAKDLANHIIEMEVQIKTLKDAITTLLSKEN